MKDIKKCRTCKEEVNIDNCNFKNGNWCNSCKSKYNKAQHAKRDYSNRSTHNGIMMDNFILNAY
jgi:hypothetical protein